LRDNSFAGKQLSRKAALQDNSLAGQQFSSCAELLWQCGVMEGTCNCKTHDLQEGCFSDHGWQHRSSCAAVTLAAIQPSHEQLLMLAHGLWHSCLMLCNLRATLHSTAQQRAKQQQAKEQQ
jgi:hypothetical protein